MVEVPGGTHAITCTRLPLADGSRIFLRTKWFHTSFSVTALAFFTVPCSWSCHVSKQELEDIASKLGINCEEVFSQARRYLGDGVSDSQYAFEAVCRRPNRPNAMRLSWTTSDMRYNDEPRMSLNLNEDNSTMELVPEFLNVLMDTTLVVKDLLARRKINKNKKVRQLAMRFSASDKVRKRTLSQQAPSTSGMLGGLDGPVIKTEFPKSCTPKLNSSTVSYEPALGLSTPTHTPSLTAHLDSRVQQHEPRTPAMESLKSSPRQVLQSVSSTSKSLNHVGVFKAGRLVSEEETVAGYGQQPQAFCFDRSGGVENYVGVSLGPLKAFSAGYHGISDNCKREPVQADVQRMRALDPRGEALQVPMSNDHGFASDRGGSASHLKLPVKVDVFGEADRVPPPRHSPEFTARLYEHGLSSWAQPRTPIRSSATTVDIGSMSRPSAAFHDVAVPKAVHKAPACDKGVLSHESRKLCLGTPSGGNGWFNPRMSSTGVESRGFELTGSMRRSASQARGGIIVLSDSEEEDYINSAVDTGVRVDHKDLPDRSLPIGREGLSDEPGSRYSIVTGRSKDSMPLPWRESIELLNMNASMGKEERSRSRLESEAQASLGWRSSSRKRKDRGDAHEDEIDVFAEGKRTQANGFLSKEQILTPRGSFSWNRGGPDAQAYVPAGAAPCVKVEREYQSDQDAVWLRGDHRNEKEASTLNYDSRAQWKPVYYDRREKLASTFNHETRAQWNTWISEAKTEVLGWEAPLQSGNSTGHLGGVGSQPTEDVVITSSPCDTNYLDVPLSLKKLDRNLDVVDFPPSDSEQYQSPKDAMNANLHPSEANSVRELLENGTRVPVESPERRFTREMDESRNEVQQLEKVKVEREVENDGESDSVDEHVYETGLYNDNEGMTGAGQAVPEVCKSRLRVNLASRRPLEKGVNGRTLPGRRGRPPGIKAQLHPKPTRSVSQGANTCTDGRTESGVDAIKYNSQRLTRAARPVGRPKHSTCSEERNAVIHEVNKSLVDVDQDARKIVPDSDYYNFDTDRGREKIKPNQIWALYDEIDIMPRSLIRVKEVSAGGSPFRVKGNWLQPHSASRRNDRQKNAGFPRSCGDFEELKETTIFQTLNCFSHRMDFTPKGDSVIQVYPREGEVWALHKKEDLKQARSENEKQGKGMEDNANFRLVVILSNCGEGRPSEILVLRKRTGYRTLWEPGYEKGLLPIGSMERFSHRIPAYKLTEKDYPDLNNSDIWDIDAAAVPSSQSKVT